MSALAALSPASENRFVGGAGIAPGTGPGPRSPDRRSGHEARHGRGLCGSTARHKLGSIGSCTDAATWVLSRLSDWSPVRPLSGSRSATGDCGALRPLSGPTSATSVLERSSARRTGSLPRRRSGSGRLWGLKRDPAIASRPSGVEETSTPSSARLGRARSGALTFQAIAPAAVAASKTNSRRRIGAGDPRPIEAPPSQIPCNSASDEVV
jgi:hypothetical protein